MLSYLQIRFIFITQEEILKLFDKDTDKYPPLRRIYTLTRGDYCLIIGAVAAAKGVNVQDLGKQLVDHFNQFIVSYVGTWILIRHIEE